MIGDTKTAMARSQVWKTQCVAIRVTIVVIIVAIRVTIVLSIVVITVAIRVTTVVILAVLIVGISTGRCNRDDSCPDRRSASTIRAAQKEERRGELGRGELRTGRAGQGRAGPGRAGTRRM